MTLYFVQDKWKNIFALKNMYAFGFQPTTLLPQDILVQQKTK